MGSFVRDRQLRLVHLGVRGRRSIGDVEHHGLVVLSWLPQVGTDGVGDRGGCGNEMERTISFTMAICSAGGDRAARREA